ncbi:MAG: CoA transferase, partial [Rhodospirillales bacterium]|nr:CoA transferase [Rhodospirillales bacterium]
VFADPQVKARGMKIAMEREGVAGGQVSMIGNPIKFSATPVDYRNPPPRLGEHTGAVLSDLLGLSPEEIENLRERGVV